MQSVEQLLTTHPALKALFGQLNKARVRWAIFAGSEVTLLTGNRASTDLDIIVHNDDFEKLVQLLPHAECVLGKSTPVTAGDGEKLKSIADNLTFVLDGTDVDIMSRAWFETKDGKFPTYLTELACEQRLTFSVAATTVYLAHPFDTILIKAFMRRGPEQNKHDQADAEALCSQQRIERSYVAQRLAETGLNAGAEQFLKHLQLLI